jgi:hypothetical protein
MAEGSRLAPAAEGSRLAPAAEGSRLAPAAGSGRQLRACRSSVRRSAGTYTAATRSDTIAPLR